MTAGKTNRNASLDWLRVVSILYITGFWHLLNYSDAFPAYHDAFFWRVTVLALGLFTLISGYLVGRGTPPATPASLLEFYKRRLIRLYPPYLFALLLFLVLRMTGRITLLKGALLLGMIVPPPPPTLWYVGMILLCYIATPGLMRLAARPAAMVGVVAAVVATLWLAHGLTGLIDPRLPLYLPAYAAGVLLARHERLRISPMGYGAMIVAAVASAFLSLPAGDPADMSIWMAPYALVATVTVFLLCNHRLPANPAIAWLSHGSFFLYLLHRPIYHIVATLTGTRTDITALPWLVFVGFPLAIAAGHVGQRAYDALVDRVMGRRTPPLPA